MLRTKAARIIFTTLISVITITQTIFLPLVAQEADMSQISRPQQGRQATYPDAGGYNANQWARLLTIAHVEDRTSQGPFYWYLDGLAVSNPAGVTIRVAKGAGFCNGHLLINEDRLDESNASNVDFTPSTPAASSRVDVVVMVQNATNAAYDGTLDYGAAVLEFPTDLTDYEGTASVPANSARLAILTGVEGAGAPRSLTQDVGLNGDIWMVELARYTISTAPAVSSLTDNRDFVDAEEITEFVQATSGEGSVTGILGPGSDGTMINTPDAEDSEVSAGFIVPENFISNMRVTAVVIPDGTGNLNASLSHSYAACGEDEFTHTDSLGLTTYAVTNGTQSCIGEITLTNAAVGDIVRLKINRRADLAADTINASMRVVGWKIEYFGYKR